MEHKEHMKRKMRWNGVWNELHPGRDIYRGIGDVICDFLHFFRIFWTPNGQKRLVVTASTRGPIRSRHVALARALAPPVPRLPLASLSPASRPGGRSSAGESEAIPPALAGHERHRPALASHPPLARAGAAAASSRPRCRPHCHRPYIVVEMTIISFVQRRWEPDSQSVKPNPSHPRAPYAV
jgi:hypothetical protein